jgi:phage repressor protein C with HTH and peptisase S24 domain
MDTMGERVAAERENKGWSQVELAAEVTRRGYKIRQSAIGNIESGRTKNPKCVVQLAAALDVNAPWLQFRRGPKTARSSAPDASRHQRAIEEMRSVPESQAIAPPPKRQRERDIRRQLDSEALVPVRSYVGAGDEIFPIEGDAPIDWVPAPPGMEAAEATEVRGNSMRPLYHDGDLLFHSRLNTDFAAYQGEAVVAQVKGGKRLVKLLQTGSKRGRYTLESVNPAYDHLTDQQLDWIGPIEWVHKRWRRQRRGRVSVGAG